MTVAPPREVSATWSAEPGSAVAARGFLTSVLATWETHALTTPVRLVVTELVTNAVVHARTDFTLTLQRLPDGVLVRVNDGAGARPQPLRDGMTPESGHGLSVVEELAAGWGTVADGAGGKAVWAVIGECFSNDPAAPAG